MSGEQNDRPSSQETVITEANELDGSDHVRSVVAMHLSMSAKLLREGSVARAFSELVRATRVAPLGGALAAALVRVALRADSAQAAQTVLLSGLAKAEGRARQQVRRQLIRLWRRLGNLEAAREELVVMLAENPRDRRARGVLNALLEREERWEELDASLEKEVKDALRRNALRRASRMTLRRARMWGERLGNDARAALRYGQAAQFAEQAGDAPAAYSLRLLWVRALHRSRAPERALADALETCQSSAERIGMQETVESLRERLLMAPTAAPARKKGGRSELLDAAAVVESKGRNAEAAALLEAVVREAPDPAAEARLEAHYVKRGAWRELAKFYRARAEATQDTGRWVDLQEKLAELLENELHDLEAAAQAYGEIVRRTGDQRGLAEQVRLLRAKEDASGLRRALDEAVKRTGPSQQKIAALVARAEAAMARRDVRAARTDFEEALRLGPSLPASAGLAEAAAALDDVGPIRAYAQALAALPKRQAGRGELYRRLARLSDHPLGDARLSRSAWAEVRVELPDDEEALARLSELARELGDDVELEQTLRALIRREARGPRTRQSRMQLVELLERGGRGDQAIAELRAAVRFEPGHREAWFALADRFIQRGDFHEAAWALEQGATATDDLPQRMAVWQRAAALCRDVLHDEERARVYLARAESVRQSIAEREQDEAAAAEANLASAPSVPAPGLLAGPLEIPVPPPSPRSRPRAPGPSPAAVGRALESEITPAVDRAPRGARAARRGRPTSGDAEDSELSGHSLTEEVDTDQASDHADPRRAAELLTRELGDPALAVPPSLAPSLDNPERERLFERVRENPLNADAFRDLAEDFDDAGDSERASLMLEISRAIAGDPDAAPLPPKLILSATDRAGLRHPLLRTDAGELFTLTGGAMTKLFPARGKEAGSVKVFGVEAGKGAEAAASALLVAVRVLGLRSPEVHLAEDHGPPFALVYVRAPRLLVGKSAIKRALRPSELRFFAGRALFSQNPDLLALRSLSREKLLHALKVLATVLDGKATTAEARLMRDSIEPRALARARRLFLANVKTLELSKLVEGSRHSANRAGLVVCGGVAPALDALRAKKALPSEMAELVRFAASERYLELRTRRFSRGSSGSAGAR